MKKALMTLSVLALAVTACRNGSAPVPAIDPGDLDTTVSPAVNFYQYANGGWIEKNPLSPEYARYGSFDKLAEDNVTRLNELFASMKERKYRRGTVGQKISDLYRQGLDSTRLNEEGALPLKEYLQAIYGAEDHAGLTAVLAQMNRYGSAGLFDMGVMEDLMDSGSQILYLSQCGLGMGEKDYYENPALADKKADYATMLARLFALSAPVCPEGITDPQAAADRVLNFEDALAGASWDNVRLRDLASQYNPMTTEEFLAAYPGVDFGTIFRTLGIPDQDKLIVMQPSFYRAVSDLYPATPLQTLQDYFAARLICDACGYMSDDFYDTQFEFYSTSLRGITEKKPRWKRAMSVPNFILGEAVGQMYVERYFPESSKRKVLEIVDGLKQALSEHIDALEWMTDSTKAYAQEKLAAFTVKIGYPDKWKDYSSLDINAEDSYFRNIMAASEWMVSDNLSKLGKPTDRSEWGMSPQTVNAYYNPTSNEICFPAAILQPPFFNADADDAVNYGAIGVVIGHEMTHGFDDQGRLFDKAGNMQGWWLPQDEAAFNAKAEALVRQYDAIEVAPGLNANGRLSLGENIADQGGVGLAYSALLNKWKESGRPADADGFTPEQRFFLGFAHVWAGNITPDEKVRLTKVDEHSLSVNRVNATLRNFQVFYDAFGISEGDPMWMPESERVMIW